MIHYIEENQLIAETMRINKLVIVEFYIQDSEPCEMQSNVLRDIEKELSDKVEVFKIDTTESQNTKMRYNLSSVPTLLFFKEAKEIERIIGFCEKNKLNNLIQELLANTV